MHSRLPLFAGVPGKSAAAALTAALLITGCTPNLFGSPESDLEPTSAVHAAPVAAQHSAQSRMTDAASMVAQRLQQAKPSGLVAASSGAQSTDSESTADQEHEARAGVERHREEVDSWSESVTEARDAAAEQQRQAEAEEAEAQRRQAEAEEAERQQAAEEASPEPLEEPPENEQVTDPETEDSQQPAPAPEAPDLEESLSTPAEPQVAFTGDMNSYLQDVAAAHPGSISISMQELTGQQRSAATGGDTSHVTASTYKFYVAYSIIRQVESGALDWSDSVSGERDLAQCFQDMIVVSDNPCPEEIGPEIGWSTIYSDAAAAGATSTGQGQGAIVTSTNDLSSMLVRLETGQLGISEAGHNQLREALAANVHRQGVPAGSAGQVLNKPGWIDGYIHDAAIVRHPQGTYVLSIMSEGSSWDSLASITRDIESALFG